MGKKKAEEYSGLCPSHVQEPFGKTLHVSFIGPQPYVIYNPLGGCDFVITKLLAKKLGFIPKFIPAKSYDIIQKNLTKYGMIHQVRLTPLTFIKVALFQKFASELWI